jgi:hypothetical protein
LFKVLPELEGRVQTLLAGYDALKKIRLKGEDPEPLRDALAWYLNDTQTWIAIQSFPSMATEVVAQWQSTLQHPLTPAAPESDEPNVRTVRTTISPNTKYKRLYPRVIDVGRDGVTQLPATRTKKKEATEVPSPVQSVSVPVPREFNSAHKNKTYSHLDEFIVALRNWALKDSGGLGAKVAACFSALTVKLISDWAILVGKTPLAKIFDEEEIFTVRENQNLQLVRGYHPVTSGSKSDLLLPDARRVVIEKVVKGLNPALRDDFDRKARGSTDKEIARARKITKSTLSMQLTQITNKFRAHLATRDLGLDQVIEIWNTASSENPGKREKSPGKTRGARGSA